MFSKHDHMPGHKTSLNKFKKIEIIPSIFSDHNSIELEINYRNKTGGKTHTHTHTHTAWRLNNMLLKNHRSVKKSKGKSKNTLI